MKVEKWNYQLGKFVHVGQFSTDLLSRRHWIEYQPNEMSPKTSYEFEEVLRDERWIYLLDHVRRLWVALSTHGYECHLLWWLPEGDLPRYTWHLQYNNGLMCNLVPYVGQVPPSGGF